MIDQTHDPALRSWVESANHSGTDFPIQNLPFGVFRRARSWRIGIAIGDEILDCRAAVEEQVLADLPIAVRKALSATTLNPFMALGPNAATGVRARVSAVLRADAAPRPNLLSSRTRADLALPVTIGDYTDFYSSLFHATNVGHLFRPGNPLFPNYKHLPIAYHGRCSSLVVGGTTVRRPWGQVKRRAADPPQLEPTDRLDYEAELAVLVGAGNPLGQPVALDEAERHVFGFCLLNDWSARDVQVWESQPLGPFLAKNFATSLSPWIVALDALAPFRGPSFRRADDDPPLLSYLSTAANESNGGLDITVEVYLQSALMRAERMDPMRLSRASLRDMYWTVAQLLTHHTVNGCNLRTGDVIATGTISGPDERARGCLLEVTQGSRPVSLPTGETRLFLADGDEVIMRGFCERPGFVRIGFGECRGVVLPALAH